jgi:hypothetical protein
MHIIILFIHIFVTFKFYFFLGLWKKELLENREKLIALDNMRLLSDRNIITRKTKAEINHHSLISGFDQINGSFRKLEVD